MDWLRLYFFFQPSVLAGRTPALRPTTCAWLTVAAPTHASVSPRPQTAKISLRNSSILFIRKNIEKQPNIMMEIMFYFNDAFVFAFAVFVFTEKR
jgi:hypothetical protein